jgi:hypothetical protein
MKPRQKIIVSETKAFICFLVDETKTNMGLHTSNLEKKERYIATVSLS